jgi:hypothetical protein
VPTEYAYLNLSAVLKVNSIDLYYGNRRIAEHKRLYNVNQWSLDPFHYMELIQQRPRAFTTARPLKQWRKTLPVCYDHLLDRFCNNKGDTKGIKEFIKVLLLHKEYKANDIHKSVNKALSSHASCSDSVLQILINSLDKPINIFAPLPNREVLPVPDVTVYNKIGGII